MRVKQDPFTRTRKGRGMPREQGRFLPQGMLLGGPIAARDIRQLVRIRKNGSRRMRRCDGAKFFSLATDRGSRFVTAPSPGSRRSDQ